VPVAVPPDATPGLLRRTTAVSIVPANLAGACAVYLYFNYVDPLGGGPTPGSTEALVVFVGVTATLVVANWYLGTRFTRPIRHWERRLRAGTAEPRDVPVDIRRRVLNAALANAVLSLVAWDVAAVFYFVNQLVLGVGLFESVRVLVGIGLVGGPVTSALAFLVGEFHWRRQIPLFFPDGKLEREGVLRVPIRVRLAATFLLTSVLPLLLMLFVDLAVEVRWSHRLAPVWDAVVRAQLYLVAITTLASTVMAFLVARFINRPVQALRAGMAAVANGDLDVRVPVRSTDELGELNQHFNAMVDELRAAARARELFGRYVSPVVARAALERGVGRGGELVHATAMFVDLRGFTQRTQELGAPAVMEMLNRYYAAVEHVTDREGGVITQFLGDGVVVVFGGPLRPLEDHARRAVRSAIDVERALAAGDDPLEAGIGICTGEMIAGNIRARQRVVYTIVGDAVNQAARLQVKTRELGARILVTESTRDAVGELPGVGFRPVGAVPLRGIAQPVRVYAVEPAPAPVA
jgi:adenylate cyclase